MEFYKYKRNRKERECHERIYDKHPALEDTCDTVLSLLSGSLRRWQLVLFGSRSWSGERKARKTEVDKETPIGAKVLAVVTVGYALSPIDLIPDFIPVLGYLDDVILLTALIALTIRLISEDVWTRCRQQSENMWKDGKPKKWYFAIPIVVIWLLIIWLIVKAIWL